MIHVVAIITAKSGMRAEYLAIFMANVPAVLAEDGCIEYSPVVDADLADPAFGPDVFLVIEKWRDRELLNAHAAAPHMVKYRRDTADLLQNVKVHVLEPASGPMLAHPDSLDVRGP